MKEKMDYEIIDLNAISDERGALVALESFKNVPFEIKRIYYLTNLKPELPRGFHAHKKLQQIIVCMSGSFDLILDDGKDKQIIHLDSPFKGVLIKSLIWREMHNFSNGCVLMTIASDFYDESDYIRSYEDFKKLVSL
ncbi:sugar 3,4-ketoisomerase [Peredibacter sp. HCB2-198]|uniref:sugar 3,4-ketoisomerase n=1 Tax=Peredibacter sp. HCB2-198 TaxID=3383025 RepID=UPI0038B60EEA